jgi:hypothetical protein
MPNKWNLDGVSVDMLDNMTITGDCAVSGALTVTGTITGNLTGSVTKVVSEYAATGAIATGDPFVSLDGTTSGLMTLAAGADGATMTVICINADNTVDIDADFGGADVTATFTVGGGLELISQDDVWYVTGINGVTMS